jgi:hypothetical protein
MPNVNLTDKEADLIRKHREKSQIAGSLTDAERELLDGSRNRKFTMDDFDRWDDLSTAERESFKKQISQTYTEAASGR